MEIVGTATKVTIYIGESDRWRQKPLYLAILEMLKQEGCAGATVNRGIAGFGAHSRIHSASIVRLSEDLPLTIEWVDDPDRVERVMPRLVEMVSEGLITTQSVEVLTYSHRRLRAMPAKAPVRDIMSREVKTVTPDTPLANVVELLVAKAFRALPVVDSQRKVVGILTDGDLLARAGLVTTSLQRELTWTELNDDLDKIRQSGLTASDLMTPAPTTVSERTPIGDAVRIMTERGIKRLPVVDQQGRLTGMVSRVDVLRALGQPPLREMAERAPQPGRLVKVGDIMVTNLPTVKAETSLDDVVDLLVTQAQRRVVVVDDQNHVAGIITDGDLLKQARENERPGLVQALTRRLPAGKGGKSPLANRTAADVMTRDPVTVQPQTPLPDALGLLLSHKIKRLPVVDDEGRLVGLVGRSEVLQALSREITDG
jgi:CBS domain-containing protein